MCGPDRQRDGPSGAMTGRLATSWTRCLFVHVIRPAEDGSGNRVENYKPAVMAGLVAFICPCTCLSDLSFLLDLSGHADDRTVT